MNIFSFKPVSGTYTLPAGWTSVLIVPTGSVQVVNNASPPESITITTPLKLGNGGNIYDQLIINGTASLVINGDAIASSNDGSAPGSAVWGSITGTPSNQADLQNGTIQGVFTPVNAAVASGNSFKTAFERLQGQITAAGAGPFLPLAGGEMTGMIYGGGVNSVDAVNHLLYNGAGSNTTIDYGASVLYDGGLPIVSWASGFSLNNIGGSNSVILRNTNLTNTRIFEFPDGPGTFSLVSDLTSYLKRNGETALTANWNVGGFSILNINDLALGVATATAVIDVSQNMSSAAWTTNGIGLRWRASTYTDTTSSGTVATNIYTHTINAATIATSSVTSFTGTNATFAILGSPIAGTNATISNGRALYVSGNTTFAGTLFMSGDLNLSGGTRIIGTTDASVLQLQSSGTVRAFLNASTSGFNIGSSVIGSTPIFGINPVSTSKGAWTTTGIGLVFAATSFTDTTSSGTVSRMNVNVLDTPTILSSSATTYTVASTLSIAPPVASTNVTIANLVALRLLGNLYFEAGSTAIFGTIDAQELQLRTANTNRIRIASTAGGGFVGIGAASPAAQLDINGASGVLSSAAWTTNGILLRVQAFTITDSSSSGTVATQVVNCFQTPTVAASSVTTYTLLANVNIGSVTAGTNVTVTNSAALRLTGNLYFEMGTSAIFGTFDSQGINIRTSNTTRFTIGASGQCTFTNASGSATTFQTYNQGAATSGVALGVVYTAGAHTGQTASAEITDIFYDLSAVSTRAAGSVSLQRDFRIVGRTYAFASASTVTTAAALALTAPVAGTNATITNNFALRSAGSICLAVAGNKLFIKEGTDGSVGVTTLTAGVSTITINGLTSSSRAFEGFVALGGTVTTTWKYKFVCTANTLTITAIDNTGATNTLDTSTMNYFIVEPAP